MADKNEGTAIALLNDPGAPEFFASEATGFSSVDGVIVITFASRKTDFSIDPPTAQRHVVGRVVMPPAGAQSLAVGLFNYLKSLGIDASSIETSQ